MNIIGLHDVVVFKERAGKETRYWAENGSIHWENSHNQRGTIVNLHDVALRLRCVADIIGQQTDRGIAVDATERKRLRDFLDQMVTLIRKAGRQGNAYYKMQEQGIIDPKEWKQSGRDRFTVPSGFYVD